jgi:uncharacterized integral membrane protein
MIRVLVYGLLWILLMGVAIFATQNTLLIAIKFLTFESIKVPLGLVLVFSAGLGAIALTIWQNTQFAEAEPSTSSQQKSDRDNFSSYSAYRASNANAANTSSASSKPKDTSTSAKNTPKDTQFSDFDEEWDDDWG